MNFSSSIDEVPIPNIHSTASSAQWQLRHADPVRIAHIRQTNELPSLMARLLAIKGVDAGNVPEYLEPKLKNQLPDPSVMKDMDQAASRLAHAILQGQKIGIFGDYDVDGSSAAAILTRYLNQINSPVEVYLPDRISEGYGPSANALLSLKATGADVVVTVDCGAAAHEPINEAAKHGLVVIVFDHHQMNSAPPEGAHAVVNPNRQDDNSGLVNLSATGVTFMAVVAVNRALRSAGFFANRQEPNLFELLDLVALGLVCDVMPISGLTRALVYQGLKTLEQGANKGLKSLGLLAGVKGRATTYHLGFLLGPRINAAGRIGHANLAFDLLTSNDEARCTQLSDQLNQLNMDRQTIEKAVQEDAIRSIVTQGLEQDDVIVVSGEGWHSGVIGIVASRVKDIYRSPTIIISLDGSTGTGSGRSIDGVDLGSAISKYNASHLLLSGGGHKMAAGLKISSDRIQEFRSQINNDLHDQVTSARSDRVLEVDAVVSPTAVSNSTVNQVNQLGPFGVGNSEPIFVLTDLVPILVNTVGQGHISAVMRSSTGETIRTISFRAEGEPLGAMLRTPGPIHVAGKIRADDWRGGDAAQLHVVDAAIPNS